MVLTGLRSKQLVALVNRLNSLPLALPSTPPDTPARSFRFSPAQITTIIEAYEAGATMASLATQYDVTRQAISGLLKREGVVARPRRVIQSSEIDEAVRLYGTGQSCVSIGDRLGYDCGTIWRALKKSGVELRSPNQRG